MSLKVLPLSMWMKFSEHRESVNPKELIDFEVGTEDIDARYFNRDHNYAWFIVDGRVYEDDVESFKYTLRLYNAPVFRDKEYKALCFLRTSHILNKDMLKKLHEYEDMLDNRNVYRESRKVLLRVRRKLEQTH